jgi:cyclohexadienyl dehydratase
MKFMKSLGLAAACVTTLMAAPVMAQSALNDILSNGVLKVGTTGDWNPMSVRDPATNAYVGYDVDVMTQLAADLEVELEFVPTDWKTLVNGVVAGNYHITGSASISPARLRAAGYSDSYLRVEILPFTTADKADRFDGWDSINQSDVSVATTLGTTFETSVRQWFPDANITVVEAPARGFQEVLSGRADVFITSTLDGAPVLAKVPPLAQLEVTEARAPHPLALLMQQDDHVWINFVNSWIELKQTQGFFDEVADRWGL